MSSRSASLPPNSRRMVRSTCGQTRSQRADATRTSKSLGTSVGHVRVAPSDSEYFDAAMRAPLLRRISDETGGRFYTPQTVASLPDDVKYTGRGVTTVEERDLWDMPIILFLLLTLLLGEWSYRRIRHLA